MAMWDERGEQRRWGPDSLRQQRPNERGFLAQVMEWCVRLAPSCQHPPWPSAVTRATALLIQSRAERHFHSQGRQSWIFPACSCPPSSSSVNSHPSLHHSASWELHWWILAFLVCNSSPFYPLKRQLHQAIASNLCRWVYPVQRCTLWQQQHEGGGGCSCLGAKFY